VGHEHQRQGLIGRNVHVPPIGHRSQFLDDG
jgi:hypothetical protein